jgi:acyl-CoA reductase-like NAD-dependent aldehyde dehydrogenase
MGLASYFFTKNVDRTWRLLENLEAGMIGMNTGPKHSFSETNDFSANF